MRTAAVPDRARPRQTLRGLWSYSRRAVELVWTTHKGLTIGLAVLTVAAII